MIKYFKSFFYPNTLIYSYKQRKESVNAQIVNILKNETGFFGNEDIIGNFENNDTFVMYAQSPVYTKGIKIRSKLFGYIIESEGNETHIQTKARPSTALYFLFFVSIIFGLVYLYKFMQTGLIGYLFWFSFMLLVLPVLIIAFSNIAIASINEKYKIYVDRKLKATENATCN